jgi:hypothetical protein
MVHRVMVDMPVHDPRARRVVVVVHRAMTRRVVLLMTRRRIVARRLVVLLILAARRMGTGMGTGMGAALAVLHVRAARLVVGLRPPLRVSATGMGRTVAVRLNAVTRAMLGSTAFGAARLIFDSGMDAAPVLPLAAGILRAARIPAHITPVRTLGALELARRRRCALLLRGRCAVLTLLRRGRGAVGTPVRPAR